MPRGLGCYTETIYSSLGSHNGARLMEAILHFTNVTTGFVTDGPKCNCGNRDWFPKGDSYWICSNCSRKRRAGHRGIIRDGPKCNCGNRGWFVGNEIVRCSYCNRSRDAICQGYIVNGPKCNCGNKDWFVGQTVYRCSYCARSRDKT